MMKNILVIFAVAIVSILVIASPVAVMISLDHNTQQAHVERLAKIDANQKMSALRAEKRIQAKENQTNKDAYVAKYVLQFKDKCNREYGWVVHCG